MLAFSTNPHLKKVNPALTEKVDPICFISLANTVKYYVYKKPEYWVAGYLLLMEFFSFHLNVWLV